MLLRSSSTPSLNSFIGVQRAEIDITSPCSYRRCGSVQFPVHSPDCGSARFGLSKENRLSRRRSVSFAISHETLYETVEEEGFGDLFGAPGGSRDVGKADHGKFGGGGGRQKTGGNSGSGSDSTEAYYKELLKSDPSNALVIRNYAKFLQEVQHDYTKAEEYYQRAILASPGDADILSSYGTLIWNVHRDAERAESYLDQAATAAPDDCYVLGSYAHFLWDKDDEEQEESYAQVTQDHNSKFNAIPTLAQGTVY